MYGRPSGPARFDPGPDLRAARAVAAIRLAVVIAIAAAGSFLPDLSRGAETYFLLVGLVGVPWAVVVLFGTESAGRAFIRRAWAGDLVSAFALQVLVPERARLALVASVAVVAVTATVVRTVSAWSVAGAAIVLTLFGDLVVPDSRVGAGETALYLGVVAGMSLLAERISGERRRAAAWAMHLEGRAAAILDSVADAVVLTDDAGVVRSLNPAARRLVGTAVPGGHCADVLGLHHGERALDCTDGCALLELTSPDGVQLWRAAAGGRRQPLLASAALAGDMEVVHSLRDVTKLLEADEAKTLFLATASHELKTPLTVINGFAATLLRAPDLPPDVRRNAVTAIHRRGQELAKIVDRLLMSSRIEAGRLALEPVPVDVGAIVAERVAAIEAATSRNVSLTGALPGEGWGTADAVATVVDHLLDNAMKYSPEGGDVEVCLSGDGGRVVVVVRDHGIGMTEDEARHCFDKFWQADASDARRYGGTGIGLYIVKSLVDAMHGDITVTSEPGKGSAFTVALPTTPHVPAPRAEEPGEPSMIREFMRQIGVREGS